MTFPIPPIPDPNDDGFEEPECELCDGTGMIQDGTDVDLMLCDCMIEEE